MSRLTYSCESEEKAGFDVGARAGGNVLQGRAGQRLRYQLAQPLPRAGWNLCCSRRNLPRSRRIGVGHRGVGGDRRGGCIRVGRALTNRPRGTPPGTPRLAALLRRRAGATMLRKPVKGETAVRADGQPRGLQLRPVRAGYAAAEGLARVPPERRQPRALQPAGGALELQTSSSSRGLCNSPNAPRRSSGGRRLWRRARSGCPGASSAIIIIR